jgi:hypothetical protein
MSYRPLRLEESSLVFFPPQTRRGGELREPTVVQVMIKMEPQSRCVQPANPDATRAQIG